MSRNTQSHPTTDTHTQTLTRTYIPTYTHTLTCDAHTETLKHTWKHTDKIPAHDHTHSHKNRTPRHDYTRTDKVAWTHRNMDTQSQMGTQLDAHSLTGTHTGLPNAKNSITPTQKQEIAYTDMHSAVFFIDFTLGPLRLIQRKETWLHMFCFIFIAVKP